jgi:hypothetical protein
MEKNSITTITLGGKTRPVKFGTNQGILFCQLRRCTTKEYIELFSLKSKNLEISISEIRDLLWSALKDGARYAKEEFNVTPEDVADWIDEANLEEIYPQLKQSTQKIRNKKS